MWGLRSKCWLALLAIFAGCQQDAGEAESRASSVAVQDSAEANPPASTSAQPPPARRPEDLPQAVALTDDDWPQYRGAQRDGVSRATGLARSWSESGPPVLWETALGQGYSAPSVVADKVYINDYDEEQNEWLVRCLALHTGEENWRYRAPKKIRPNHAITRTAPAVDGGYVIAMDPKCEVHCLDARDGSLIWRKFLPEAYASQIPPWYNGQCPLIDGDRIVIATGGRVLLTALEKATGKPVWETANTDEFLLSHSSVVPAEIDGVRQYAYNTLKGAVGVDAATGRQLWHFPWQFNTAVSTSPLWLGEGKFLLTAGYHAQTVVFQVTRDGEAWTTHESLALAPPTQGWNSEVHTPIVYRGRVYGIGKKRRGLWTCLDLEGNELWTSDRQASFGMGGYVLADGMFFVLEGKTGTLRVLDASADEYRELANFTVLEGPDVWAPPVIAHGRLLIRDLSKLVCLDVSSSPPQLASAEEP